MGGTKATTQAVQWIIWGCLSPLDASPHPQEWPSLGIYVYILSTPHQTQLIVLVDTRTKQDYQNLEIKFGIG